jgi:hypothetical protein
MRARHRRTQRRAKAYGKYLPKALVDSTGTRRRIEALAAVGWDFRYQSVYIGHSETLHVVLRQAVVQAETERRVRKMYDELSTRKPTGTFAPRTVRWAAGKGFAPPLAWDDDTIDDPAVERADRLEDTGEVDQVALSYVLGGYRMRLIGRDRVEAIRSMTSNGMTSVDIGVALGVSERRVLRIRNENGIIAPSQEIWPTSRRGIFMDARARRKVKARGGP